MSHIFIFWQRSLNQREVGKIVTMKILEVLIVNKNEDNDGNPMQGKYDSSDKKQGTAV